MTKLKSELIQSIKDQTKDKNQVIVLIKMKQKIILTIQFQS